MAEIVAPRMLTPADEVKDLSWDDLISSSHSRTRRRSAQLVDHGATALRPELESSGPETRATLARVLAEVG